MDNETDKPVKQRNDWKKLKAEFLTSDILTIKDFLASKGITKFFNNYTAGWAREKRQYRDKVLAKVEEVGVQKEATNLVEARERQARLSRFLQLKGAEKLKTVESQSLGVNEARKLVVSGMEQERKALGLDNQPSNLTQINIQGGPKTNLDRMVEELSYEELLELIAVLKRSRARRTISEASDVSEPEVEEGESE
jgi:hypothetical protein